MLRNWEGENGLLALARFIDLAFTVYQGLIIIRVLLSWFRLPSGRYFYSFSRFIYEITEPFLALFRRILPAVMVGGAGIDFSPIVAILVLRLLQTQVLKLIFIYL